MLAGLGIAGTSVRSRHWAEIHPLKARTLRAGGHCLAGAPAGAGAERKRTDQGATPLFRRLAEHLESPRYRADRAALGDDAPLLLLRSVDRLSGMLQRAPPTTSPKPGVVGAVVAQVKQAASQLLAPGAPIDNERDAHKAMRAQQEAARPLCAWWLKQKATDLRALRPQPDDALAAHRVHARALCRTGPLR
ncbi:hypothetical protein ACPA9J_07770 [Pseudomonas aeruginosa]